MPAIDIRYYPYVNLNHTIRIRGGKVFVRISDLLEDAPSEVHEALARILVAKVLRTRVPGNANAVYRKFASSDAVRAKAREQKRLRGRKEITSAEGEHYDLGKIFRKLNLVYFGNRIEKPELSWSKKRTYRRLGHHDEAHRTIVISRSLDSRSVPKFVVEYVMYHEMLHIKHPPKVRGGRRFYHTPEFRRDEELFPYFDEAEEWLEENAAMLRKKALKDKPARKRFRLRDLID